MIDGQEESENKINACIWDFAGAHKKFQKFKKRKKKVPDLAILSGSAYELFSKSNLLVQRDGNAFINHQLASEIRAYNADNLDKEVLDEVNGDLDRILKEQREYDNSVTLFKKRRMFGIIKKRYKTYDLNSRVMDLCTN